MKTWKVAIVGALSMLLIDMISHVETDPKWVLYIHYGAWYIFGCAIGEASYERKLINAVKKEVGK